MSSSPVFAVAHRGASAYAPENTVAAFDEAVRLGARAVEFDLRVSADGIPVVIHDPTVDRTTSGTGRVADLDLLDLRRFDAGSWLHRRFGGTRIPTLEEALLAIGPYAMPVIELKVPPPPSLIDLLRKYDLEQDALVPVSTAPGWPRCGRVPRKCPWACWPRAGLTSFPRPPGGWMRGCWDWGWRRSDPRRWPWRKDLDLNSGALPLMM
jgi:hypothetical protein